MMDTKKRSGFTMMEMLIVITIILVLAGLLLPALAAARAAVRKKTARTEVKELVKAWNSYCNTYSNWDEEVGLSFDMTPEKVAVLEGRDSAKNPYSIVFMEFSKESRDLGFRDPWKKPGLADRQYHVKLARSYVENVWRYETRTSFINRKSHDYD